MHLASQKCIQYVMQNILTCDGLIVSLVSNSGIEFHYVTQMSVMVRIRMGFRYASVKYKKTADGEENEETFDYSINHSIVGNDL